jgi:hypothetical protein
MVYIKHTNKKVELIIKGVERHYSLTPAEAYKLAYDLQKAANKVVAMRGDYD